MIFSQIDDELYGARVYVCDACQATFTEDQHPGPFCPNANCPSNKPEGGIPDEEVKEAA